MASPAVAVRPDGAVRPDAAAAPETDGESADEPP
jgi:hypothetical protein